MDAHKKAAGLGRGEAANQTQYARHRIAPIPSQQGADALLSRLERIRQTGRGTWLARCPAHDDRGPSLSIREKEDGTVLLHCFSGCSAHEVVAAVGLEIADLFPPRPTDPAHVGKPERRPFPAADVLRAVAFESNIVALSALHLGKGDALSDADRARLLVANGRIQAALDAAGVNDA